MFEIDSTTRLRIAEALLETAGQAQAYACIPLAGERTLLIESRCPGTVRYLYLSGEVDLLGDLECEDVTLIVNEAMADNLDWLKSLADALAAPATEKIWEA